MSTNLSRTYSSRDDFEEAGLTHEEMQAIDMARNFPNFNDGLLAMCNYKMYALKTSISTDVVRNLRLKGVPVGSGTVASAREVISQLLEEQPSLRHDNPAIVFLKLIYWINWHHYNPAEEEEVPEEEEQAPEPKRKTKKASGK